MPTVKDKAGKTIKYPYTVAGKAKAKKKTAMVKKAKKAKYT
tara:strand:- start:54 stop:176 length:123 start_codon:yes stop_codon:yes gene_type:complete